MKDSAEYYDFGNPANMPLKYLFNFYNADRNSHNNVITYNDYRLIFDGVGIILKPGDTVCALTFGTDDVLEKNYGYWDGEKAIIHDALNSKFEIIKDRKLLKRVFVKPMFKILKHA